MNKEREKHSAQHYNVVELKRIVTDHGIHAQLESLQDKEESPVLEKSVQFVHSMWKLGWLRGLAIPSLFC